MPTVQEALLSNDYHDYLIPNFLLNDKEFMADHPDLIALRINDDLTLAMVPPRFPLSPLEYELLQYSRYYGLPNLYTLLDTVNLEESGITNAQIHPYLSLSGEGVLIGFIDTGISYNNPAFLTEGGQTRIVRIWDQTIEGGTPPEAYPLGSEYTQEDINQALASPDPLSVVPTTDTNGHGTFMASVAAGSSIPTEDFIGAAPKAHIAMVKLREAKPYLKEYFLITGTAPAYAESDILLALAYLQDLARKMSIPNVICLGLGTNNGEHIGQSPLALSFGTPVYFTSNANIVAVGNEGLASHHFSGTITSESETMPVEILVNDNTFGFTTELWGQSPEIFTVGFTSPSGETIRRISPTMQRSERVSFVLEKTIISVYYESINQLIFMRFINPTPGIWKINVSCSNIVQGRFHIWLPISGFSNPDVTFLNPDPYTTLTIPSDTANVITVGGYNAYNGSSYISTGRGLTRSGLQKPDLCAPAVDVYGVNERGNSIRKTGTSAAAAMTAGGVALILQWGAVRRIPPIRFNNIDIKNVLIRGANRTPDKTYPSREWGYGTLDIFSSFTVLTNP